MLSIDPNTFRDMFAASEPPASDQFEEPPVSSEMIEPPIRSNEPPPSKQEIEAALDEELLKIAAEEEKELKSVRRTMRTKDTFLIRCPNGCQIRVKEQHRGRAGKCPRCQSEFIVPTHNPSKKD